MSCIFGSVSGLCLLFHCMSISLPGSLRKDRQQLFKPRGRCAAFLFLPVFFGPPFILNADTNDNFLHSDVCSRYSSPHLMAKDNEERRG